MPEVDQSLILLDLREAGPKPPYDGKPLTAPGTEEGLRPKADHGETSYRGCGRLQGTAALITGGDSGIGRAVAIAFAREGADILISMSIKMPRIRPRMFAALDAKL